MNYPLATDPRVRAEWWKSQNTGRWLCDLPGDDRIQFRLPRTARKELRRCPTAFDMNLLFLLLAEARMTGSSIIKATHRALLKRLGMSAQTTNHQSLRASLDRWQSMSIRFREWYHPRSRDDDSYIDKQVLPPPIYDLELSSHGLRIELDGCWWEMVSRGYYAQVPFPLPIEAPTQNLVLWLLTVHSTPVGDKRLISNKSVERVCSTIGLYHNNRAQSFNKALEGARSWFQAHDGDLSAERSGSLISFIIEPPLVQQSRNQAIDQEHALDREQKRYTKPKPRAKPKRQPKLIDPTDDYLRMLRKLHVPNSEPSVYLHANLIKTWDEDGNVEYLTQEQLDRLAQEQDD